jgi:hypothetical protein
MDDSYLTKQVQKSIDDMNKKEEDNKNESKFYKIRH